MKKRFSIIFNALIIAMAITAPALLSYAQSGSGTVTVAANQVMTQAETYRYRTGAFSYVDIQANAVYPAGLYNNDNLKYCWTGLYQSNTNAQYISNHYKLKEGQDYTHVTILEGYLNTVYFDICFAGDTSAPAVVDYTYDGK